MNKRTCALAALAFFTFGPALAQNTAASEATKPRAMTKDADPGWEVVTVRPSDPSDDAVHRVRLRGRHVVFPGDTVEEIMLLGYGVQKSQIVGAPDWVKTERWNVDGIPDVEGEPDLRQIQGLMQKILKERFGVKLHHEQREIPVYALIVAKGGAKLTKSTGDPEGQPRDTGSSMNGQVSKRFMNTSMPNLILTLLFYTDRPVLDQTGIKGRYDFQLKWLSDDARASEPDAPPGLFTAIKEQIGLKLEPVKALADVLVIDAVERPGAN